MSTIQLSAELLKEIQTVLQKHDEATSDPGIAIQYLSAVIGYQLASLPNDLAQKQEFLDQLFQFANHVMSEHSQPEEGQSQQQAEAYGVWKPEENTH